MTPQGRAGFVRFLSQYGLPQPGHRLTSDFLGTQECPQRRQ